MQGLDDVWVKVVEDLAEDALDSNQRTQIFLKLSDGGLGLSSACDTAPLGFLASWALVWPNVADAVGVVSWSTFSAKCVSVAQDIATAEEDMAQRGKNKLRAHDWVSGLFHSKGGQQGVWARELKSQRRVELIQALSEDDRVDFRSSGGPGAGGFLEAPVIKENESLPRMPNHHFKIALRDRLRLQVCPDGSTCLHRNTEGVVCGQPLDRRGKHAKLCNFGQARNARHDSLWEFC